MKRIIKLLLLTSIVSSTVFGTDYDAWREEGFKSFAAQKWINYGITNPKDAKAWGDVRTAKMWIKAGYNSPKQVNKIKEAWKKENYDSSDIIGWLSIGIKSPKEAKEWEENGFDYYDAHKWINIGITDSTKAKSWNSIRSRHRTTVQPWIKAGYNSPKQVNKIIEEWKNEIRNPTEILDWLSIGVKTPNEVKEWGKYNLNNSYSVNVLFNTGVKSIEEYKEWNEAYKLDSNNAGYWNFINSKEIEDLKRKGIKTSKQYYNYQSELVDWKEIGVDRLWKVTEWKNIGVSLNQAEQWLKHGFYRAKEARLWIESGITNPKKAKEFKDAEIIPYDTIVSLPEDDLKEWKEEGFKLKEITQWLKLGFKEPDDTEDWIELLGNYPFMVKKAIENGFKTPDDFEDYSKIELNHAIIVKQSNIKPNKLIESMSRINKKYKSYLFNSKERFVKIYNAIEDECDILEGYYNYSESSWRKSGKCYIVDAYTYSEVSKNKVLLTTKKSVNITGKKLSSYEQQRMSSFELAKFAKDNYAPAGYLYLDTNGNKMSPTGIVKITRGSYDIEDKRDFEASKAKVLFMRHSY